MKIYTQEQVIEVFEKYGNMSAINARNILDLSESIELPSDEEICKEAYSFYKLQLQYKAFIQGMKSMRDKIQGGNK
jgi:hypothetical protein